MALARSAPTSVARCGRSGHRIRWSGAARSVNWLTPWPERSWRSGPGRHWSGSLCSRPSASCSVRKRVTACQKLAMPSFFRALSCSTSACQ